MAYSPFTASASGLALHGEVMAALRGRLPLAAARTVVAVTDEVPDYTGALTGAMAETIAAAVEMALGGFLRLAEQTRDADASTPLRPALEGAYALGRGEARSGRSTAALLAAYRVGARVSWRELSAVAVASGLPADTIAQFAELVFAYIDALSAASVAGHADELATSGRVLERYREQLTEALLAGRPQDQLVTAAERAGWPVPGTLTAVLLPDALVRTVLPHLGPQALAGRSEAVGDDIAVLLVPDVGPPDRQRLLRLLAGSPAVIGPTRTWCGVAESHRRALHARALGLGDPESPVDTEEHLTALVVHADPDALADLRRRALAPLAELGPATAERLEQTLRSWLLHLGRREGVASELFVHPQTVRYRMGQLRELFGDRLTDPATVLDLVVALAPAWRGAAGQNRTDDDLMTSRPGAVHKHHLRA